jgi:hypothetical protein
MEAANNSAPAGHKLNRSEHDFHWADFNEHGFMNLISKEYGSWTKEKNRESLLTEETVF